MRLLRIVRKLCNHLRSGVQYFVYHCLLCFKFQLVYLAPPKYFSPPIEQPRRGIMIIVILHICGNVSDRLDLIADTGYDGVSLDSMVDLAYAKKEVGDRICLIGNVDVFKPLREGTPAEVVKKAEECIETAGAGGGFAAGE